MPVPGKKARERKGFVWSREKSDSNLRRAIETSEKAEPVMIKRFRKNALASAKKDAKRVLHDIKLEFAKGRISKEEAVRKGWCMFFKKLARHIHLPPEKKKETLGAMNDFAEGAFVEYVSRKNKPVDKQMLISLLNKASGVLSRLPPENRKKIEKLMPRVSSVLETQAKKLGSSRASKARVDYRLSLAVSVVLGIEAYSLMGEERMSVISEAGELLQRAAEEERWKTSPFARF